MKNAEPHEALTHLRKDPYVKAIEGTLNRRANMVCFRVCFLCALVTLLVLTIVPSVPGRERYEDVLIALNCLTLMAVWPGAMTIKRKLLVASVLAVALISARALMSS